MSARSFSVSIVASAVMLMLGSFPSVANTVTESIEKQNSYIDLQQADIALFHYRESGNVLAKAGVTVHPSADHITNPISVRGATNGVAIMQDNIFYSAAPYSGQNIVLQPNLFFQSTLSSHQQTNVGQGGQGGFGLLNYTSIDISPREIDTVINLEINEDGSPAGGILVGGKTKQYGMLLGVDYQKADTDSGFITDFDNKHEQTDIMFKINSDSLPGARNHQKTEFSYYYSDKTSDTSKIGLTDDDFTAKPNGRYAATQLDYEHGKRQRYALAHQVSLPGQSKVFTDFYYQTFSQRGHDTLLLEDELINNLSLMQLSEFEKAPTAEGLLTSASKNDNDFAGFGVQSKGITTYGPHEVIYQARYHTDKAEMRVGGHDYLINQDLSLTKQDSDYAIGKYTDDADAITTAVNAKLNYEKLSVNFGLGYEHVSVSRELGDNTELLTAADFSDDGWIPSIEVAYQQNAWLFALSAKQAWTAAGAGNTEQLAQEALQYQLAINYQQDGLNVGLTAYMHDFDNMHSTCKWGVNCDPIQNTQQVNLKDVSVSGIDVSVDYSVNLDWYSIPFALDYRYTQAEFGQTGCDMIVGCYTDGSQLPWVPEQQVSASVGFVMDKFSIVANALYQTETGSPFFPGNYGIDSQWNIDLAAQYQMSKEHKVYVRVENLLDDDLVAKNYQMGIISQGELKTYIGYQGHF